MSKKRFFAGTFLLSAAGIISRIMGFFYRIFLSQTIGSRGIGLYQLVVPLQHMVLAVTTSGIQTALSRTVASQTALKQKFELPNVLFVIEIRLFSHLNKLYAVRTVIELFDDADKYVEKL